MEDIRVYMVVNLEIEDKNTYLKYEKGFFPILKRHGGEFLTLMILLGILKEVSLCQVEGL